MYLGLISHYIASLRGCNFLSEKKDSWEILTSSGSPKRLQKYCHKAVFLLQPDLCLLQICICHRSIFVCHRPLHRANAKLSDLCLP